MIAAELEIETAPHTGPVGGLPSSAVLTVVGFDGSGPSLAALDTATQLIRGRSGHLEVVYVAHLPVYVGLSAPAIVGMRQALDDITGELDIQVRAVLDDREPRWHFQRRDGSVAKELAAAASELRHQQGPEAAIVIVIGASPHMLHHHVAVTLARAKGFPLLVVPTGPPSPPNR